MQMFALIVVRVQSGVEVLSAALVIYRFCQKRATLGIGALFIILILGTWAASIVALVTHDEPDSSEPSLIVSAKNIELRQITKTHSLIYQCSKSFVVPVRLYLRLNKHNVYMKLKKMISDDNFEYVNEASISSELICTICQDPFTDPRIAECEHVFCNLCITDWMQKGNNSCPIDRTPISKLTHLNRPFRNLLNDLEVKCRMCGQTRLKRSDFDNHVKNVCPNTGVVCLAADIKCQWVGSRQELNNHMQTCDYQRMRPVLDQLIMENEHLKIRLVDINSEQNQSLVDNAVEINRLQTENNRLNEVNELLRTNATQQQTIRTVQQPNPRQIRWYNTPRSCVIHTMITIALLITMVVLAILLGKQSSKRNNTKIGWTMTGNMMVDRADHTASLLPDEDDLHEQRAVKREEVNLSQYVREERFCFPERVTKPFEMGFADNRLITQWMQNNEELTEEDNEKYVDIAELAAAEIIEGKLLNKELDRQQMAAQFRSCKSENEVLTCAVRLYSLSSFLFTLVNTTLRHYDWSKVDTFGPFCYLLWQYLLHNNTPTQQLLYRGMTLSDEMLNEYKQAIGNEIVLPTFTSTSKDRGVAELFSGNTLCIISMRGDKRGQVYTDISSISNYPDEQEVLLDSDHFFIIEKVEYDQTNGKHVIYLEDFNWETSQVRG
ncbi:hypothetical protein I4U23_004488 [Adineta vaga]|nr:hypothetical protein I4U23_004488 [Adineta vaga]